MAIDWLLCCYRLPTEPTRLRLAIWRRLRRIGAVMLHDGLWTLPASPQTREDFEWLAEEIEERGGSVLVWEARSIGAAQDRAVVERFRADAAERYDALVEAARQLGRIASRRALKAGSVDQAMQRLRALERGLHLDRKRDYFKGPGRPAADQAIREAVAAVKARMNAAALDRRQRAVGD